MRYQLYFKDDGDHLFAAEGFMAGDDPHAIERARRLYRSGIVHGCLDYASHLAEREAPAQPPGIKPAPGFRPLFLDS